MKKIVLFIVIVFIGLSCSNISKKKNNTSIDKNETTEKFDDFLLKFFKDNVFRSKRVSFPLKGYNSDLEEGKRDIEWNKTDWEFYSQDDLNYSENNNIKSEIKEKGALKLLRLYKENSGYDMNYHFEKEKGKWYLKFYSYKNI